MTHRVRIILADDHALVRAGLRALLEQSADFEVVGEAGTGDEAVALARTASPDVALLDIAMAGRNGLDAAADIRRNHPAIRIVMLSMHATTEYVTRALGLGVSGYLLKDGAASELGLAIRAVMQRGIYLSPAISGVFTDDFARASGHARPGGLTPRQLDVLRRVAEGASTKEIAFTLGLSRKTVESHRTQLMKRLNIHDVAGLVRFAMRAGLVPPEH